jgi:carbamoylphosphate synthase large subunit
MTAIILRRRKLGRATKHVTTAMTSTCKVVRNWVSKDWPDAVLYVFRWGCTSSYPVDVMHTVNSADSIHWCSNKRQGRLDMQAAGVPVPKTWGSVQEWFDAIPGGTIAPVVARPQQHAQGRNLLLSAEPKELREFEARHGSVYLSEYIKKVAEFRVLVCQNRAVWVAKKTPGNPEDIAWNVARGGSFDNVRWGEWNLSVVRAALAAAKVSKTDFCGVDVMVDDDGKPYVLEVNSAPSQTSPYRQSCLAKAFDYICTHGKNHFDDVVDNGRKTWKSYIHPALRGNDGSTD